jgi:superfamily II DNA or RNA helicase
MRREIPRADLVIIDEAHVMFDFYHKWFNNPEWQNIPFVGLSATPWQKGMGKLYQSLIIGTTTQELIDAGHLSNFRCFAADHPDLRGVKTVAGDYETKSLSKAMDKPTLIGDIVSTWLEKANGLPTLCFGVDRVHAKNIQKQFEAAGVKTAYQDAYTDFAERRQIATDFNNGDIQIVCNVGTLTTGVDWDVRCIILARPTKSEILYTQIIGRGLRTAEGKKDCLILDHSDTTLRLGFVTDLHHDKLDSGEKKGKREAAKAERLPKECSKCKFVKPLRVFECPNCGHKPDPKDNIYSAVGELNEIIRDGKRKSSSWTQSEKAQFYAELLGHCQAKGYKQGWAYHAYRRKFGVGPKGNTYPLPPSPATLSWIRHMNIAKAMMKAKRETNNAAGQNIHAHYGISTPQMATNP